MEFRIPEYVSDIKEYLDFKLEQKLGAFEVKIESWAVPIPICSFQFPKAFFMLIIYATMP